MKNKMAKHVKIKEIAQMAGVSAGTVDRILHNRGKVSVKSRDAVERVLAEVGYKYNIHTSAVSYRKEITIYICIPNAIEGEYWGSVKEGLEHALEEFSDIQIKTVYHFYDQYDVYSCREAYDKIKEGKPDAVIIGSTYAEETVGLCQWLDSFQMPYVFVDSITEGTNPYETFTTDQYTCGYLLAKILDSTTPSGKSLAIFRFQRVGNLGSSNSSERKRGFKAYMQEEGKTDRLVEASLPASDTEQIESTIINFLRSNPEVKGIATMNSRGSILADTLRKYNITGVQVISFDLTCDNVRCLKDGYISALLCQKPQMQGFNAVKSIINKLLYNMPAKQVHHLMPIDIIFKENLPYYKGV